MNEAVERDLLLSTRVLSLAPVRREFESHIPSLHELRINVVTLQDLGSSIEYLPLEEKGGRFEELPPFLDNFPATFCKTIEKT